MCQVLCISRSIYWRSVICQIVVLVELEWVLNGCWARHSDRVTHKPLTLLVCDLFLGLSTLFNA